MTAQIIVLADHPKYARKHSENTLDALRKAANDMFKLQMDMMVAAFENWPRVNGPGGIDDLDIS